MRTTLTLDDDVAIRIETIRRERRAALREVVNDALRLGLERMSETQKGRKARFETQSVDAGAVRLRDVDNISETLALLESDGFK